VHIDETLNWSVQTSHVVKKLAKVNGVLYQIRKTVPRTLLVSIFNALIQLHLSYGISVWGCGGDTCSLLKKLLELCLVVGESINTWLIIQNQRSMITIDEKYQSVQGVKYVL
jgi:hypothetical protein